MKLKNDSALLPAENKTSNSFKSLDFPIVGIGASAGGLEVLEQFFTLMPGKTGMAFVIIQHLDPNHKDLMPELLQRVTPMKVLQVTDCLKIKPNSIYIIPPNKNMSLLKGSLYLFDPAEKHGLRLPIDYFFRSLANDQQEKSIGIILSGMGFDGSLGLKAIKDQNGSVLVQDPATAKFNSMPQSAIKTTLPDIIAPVEELPAKLIHFLKFNSSIKVDLEINLKNNVNIDKIIILLREKTGHDFHLYKKSTLFRRIERRKNIHNINILANYVRFLEENPKEIEFLFKELLIGVTNFFRDTEVWEKLKKEVLPELIKKLPDGYIIRAWISGCSTGEEAYSLAIIFTEVLEKIIKKKNISLQIFATDLDNEAIEKARKGVFSENIEADVSTERLSRFFSKDQKGYHINTSIREMIIFATHNVIKDPPFTKLDILSCRNMLIYMEPELQKKIILLFNYSLKIGGIMVLGLAENIGVTNEGFEVNDFKLKIFKKSSQNSAGLLNFPSAFTINNKIKKTTLTTPLMEENIEVLADQILLQQFAPASVMTSQKGDIIYITGRTGKYLEPTAGKANWNIFAMLHGELRRELPLAFQKALENYNPIKLNRIALNTSNPKKYVEVILQQIEKPDALKGKIMIVFKDLPDSMESEQGNIKTGERISNTQQKKIETELVQRNEDIKDLREGMLISQEELKSTNEELKSSNEELQSTNEELTTSKEEMQSLNEELQAMNAELQRKMGDYVQAKNDMENLYNSSQIATLFLDKKLNIRRFTEKMTGIIKMRNTDIGRPFTDLVSNLHYKEIESDVQQVLKTLIPIEKSIDTIDGKFFDVKITPYRTIDDRIEGLVLTFINVTKFKTMELDLKKANEKLQNK